MKYLVNDKGYGLFFSHDSYSIDNGQPLLFG